MSSSSTGQAQRAIIERVYFNRLLSAFAVEPVATKSTY